MPNVMIPPPFFIFHPLPKSFPLCHLHQSLSQHVHSKHQFDTSPLPASLCCPHHCLWRYAHLVHPALPSLTSCPSQMSLTSRMLYMHIAPSSPKAECLWEAFNHAKEYNSEARDRTPPLLPMDAESTSKARRCEAHDSPATPITPAMRRHSPSLEASRTRHNSEDSYDDCKDPSHPLYQYDYREVYR